MSILEYNRAAWNAEVAKKNIWTQPVGQEQIEQARNGDVKVLLTPKKWVPKDWLGELKGSKILGLASGGGQQGPLFAAAGAEVTIFDNSDAQLEQDAAVAKAFDLDIKLVQGNMQDLSCFDDASFEMIFHPCSNCFIDDILPVWKECARVLQPGGVLLSGFCNPVTYAVDFVKLEEQKVLEISCKLPFSDERDLPAELVAKLKAEQKPMEFGHTLTDQIGGQLAAGFMMTGFYEDGYGGEGEFDPYMDVLIATRSIRS